MISDSDIRECFRLRHQYAFDTCVFLQSISVHGRTSSSRNSNTISVVLEQNGYLGSDLYQLSIKGTFKQDWNDLKSR